jgi:CRISPR-associated protein Csx17
MSERTLLTGCRSDSLSGYLKALGVMRTLATQLDANIRGSWSGVSFSLDSHLNLNSLVDFFSDQYKPTPILNPWNSGAGFDPKSRPTQGKSFDLICESHDARFEDYKTAIQTARVVLQEIQSEAVSDKDRKQTVLERLRHRYQDRALEWMDAAIILGSADQTTFPPLLGSGGNDGRLDFSVNFAARLVELIGDGRQRDNSRKLLRDAMLGTHAGKLLTGKVIGQYAPESAGGVNSTTGFDSDSLINPWDYILILEGAICFTASLSRRHPGAMAFPIAPFTFRTPLMAGFASASSEEETRGEIWLPQWNGSATYRSIQSMLREGRLEVTSGTGSQSGAHTAMNALEGAHAALSFGSAHGIDRFQRVLIAQRNGLAFAATSAGIIRTGEDRGFAALSRETLQWVSRIKRDTLGALARNAYGNYLDAVLAFSESTSEPVRRARALQEIISTLGELDRALSLSPPRDARPIPFVNANIWSALDDRSVEHDLARSLCSIGRYRHSDRLRFHISNIKTIDNRLEYHSTPKVEWLPGKLTESLAGIADRRGRLADFSERDPSPGHSFGASLDSIARFVQGTLDEVKLSRLIVGYSILPPAQDVEPAETSAHADPVPAALAALIIMANRIPAIGNSTGPVYENAIISLLSVNRTKPALQRLYQRLRESEYEPRRFIDTDIDGPRYAAASLFPLRKTSYSSAQRIVNRATVPQRTENAHS